MYNFHRTFYSRPEKRFQDEFLLKHMHISSVKRHRVESDKQKQASSYSTKYFVRTGERKLIRVCVNAFVNILHVSRFRLNNISDQYHRNGFAKDHRGGFQHTQKEKYDAQKEDVKSFIKLHCVKESHYCRSKLQYFRNNSLMKPRIFQPMKVG